VTSPSSTACRPRPTVNSCDKPRGRRRAVAPRGAAAHSGATARPWSAQEEGEAEEFDGAHVAIIVFQMFQKNIANVSRDVAYILHICCKSVLSKYCIFNGKLECSMQHGTDVATLFFSTSTDGQYFFPTYFFYIAGIYFL